MIELLVLSFVLLALLAISLYLLGFSLGREGWQAEALRTRAEAAWAERRLHDTTRQAFVAMLEQAERSRRQQDKGQ